MAPANGSTRNIPHDSTNTRSRTPLGILQTQQMNPQSRYSYEATPCEMQRPTFQPYSSPTNTTIDESPLSPVGQQQPDFQRQASPYPAEKDSTTQESSLYSLPPTHEIHPAHFAPYAEETAMPRSHIQSSSALESSPTHDLPQGRGDYYKFSDLSSRTAVPIPSSAPPEGIKVKLAGTDPRQPAPLYNPGSLAGPNVTPENHRPGQVSHPNSALNPEWKHGLCELDTICCTGLFCPCIIYGRTQYRLTQKTEKRDATDLLGYKSCNGSCELMTVACGFQCRFSAYIMSPELYLIQQ